MAPTGRHLVLYLMLILVGLLIRDQYELLIRTTPAFDDRRPSILRTDPLDKISQADETVAKKVAAGDTAAAAEVVVPKEVTKSSTGTEETSSHVAAKEVAAVPKSLSTPESRLPCLNEDFQSEHDTAVVTMNTGGIEYLNGSLVLGRSIQMHSLVEVDLVVLELIEKPLDSWSVLKKVGWKQCTVGRIPPPPGRKTNQWFMDQFTKLHAWQLIMYKSVVYMDADTLAIGNVDKLLTLDLEDKKIGVSRDYRTGQEFANTFNLGVFKIHPSLEEYAHLMKLKEANKVKYEETMSEQGWLNVVYKTKWKEIGFEHNANLAAISYVSGVDKLPISIVHFTIPKPWKGCHRDNPDTTDRKVARRRPWKVKPIPFCDMWFEAWDSYESWSKEGKTDQAVVKQPNLIELSEAPDTAKDTQVVSKTKLSIPEPRLPCLNKDFQSEHDIAVVTMNTGGAEYLNGSLVLGRSIQLHSTIPVDFVVLELTSKPLTSESWGALRRVGWKQCLVERIPPPPDRRTNEWLIDQFTKLRAWQLTMYKSIIYLDADTLAIDNVDKLLSLDLEGKKIGVSRDYLLGEEWAKTFNVGVFKISPSAKEYTRLLKIKENNLIKYAESNSEQGWLNVVYATEWKEIGFEHNANLAAIAHTKKAGSLPVALVHYTIPKPWDGCFRDPEEMANMAKKRWWEKETVMYCAKWFEAWDNYTEWMKVDR